MAVYEFTVYEDGVRVLKSVSDTQAILNVEDGATADGVLGDTHAGEEGNPHNTTAADVGAVDLTAVGAANGVASLDGAGLVPTDQLPPGLGANGFSTVAVSGQSDVVADSSEDTLTLVAGANITITTDASTDSITITSTAPAETANAFGNIAVSGQSTVVADTASDTLTLAAGSNITLTTNATSDTVTIASAQQNAFSNVAVSGQTTVAADSATDTLTLVAGDNVTITTDAATDTVTIAASADIGATPAYTRFTVGATNIDADDPAEAITIIAGSNVTLTPDAGGHSITISATGSGAAGSSFGNIAVASQATVAADAVSDTLTVVAGGGMVVTTDAAGDAVTFRTIQAGTSQRWWHAADPSIGESTSGAKDGGLKTTNTAAQNATVMVDLFSKIHNNSSDNIFVEFPSGTFAINKSLSPSGQDQDWTDGQRMTLFFPKTQFNFSGTLSNYNQVKGNVSGTWTGIGSLSPKTTFPMRMGNSAVAGGAVPIVKAAGSGGTYRQFGVLFDVSNCGGASGPGMQVKGNLIINGPASSPFSSGLIGIGAGRLHVGDCKNTSWDSVQITGCDMGMAAWRTNETLVADIGDSFTSANFGWLDIRGCGRGFMFLANGADAMNIGKLTIACRDTSYAMETYFSVANAFLSESVGNEVSLTTPNPKILELMGAGVDFGALYCRGGKSPARAWSIVNIGEGSSVSVGTLHCDQVHSVQRGCLFSMATDDRGTHASVSGTLSVAATSQDTAVAPITSILGVVPATSAARFAHIVATNKDTVSKPAGTPPIEVIPDYGSTTAPTASSNDRFMSWGRSEGMKYQGISSGTLGNVSFP